VFASFTSFLYQHELVVLTPCPESPRAVSEEALLDFYMWHFTKLVPLLNLNDTLKWPEPLCYAQSRIGLLILLFQGLVVLPAIAAVRFYWHNRHALDQGAQMYVSGTRAQSGGNRR
jgi:hypothetical protein